MRIAVLCASGSWYFRDLQRAARDRHEVVALPFTHLAATLSLPGEAASRAAHDGVLAGAAALDDFDAVLVRTMPPGSLEQVVFRMDALAQLEASGKVVLNPPRSIEAAVDKYLASARLVAAGLDHPPTIVSQDFDAAMAAFERLGGDVVVKPLFGAEGRGITRVSDEAIAHRIFKSLCQIGAVLYLQAFVPHSGYDWRVLLIGDRAFGMQRTSTTDWRTNVSRGATTKPLALTDDLVVLARRAAQATGAVIAGVDLLPARDGRIYTLEVNAVPGWQALARTLDVDVAKSVIDETEWRASNLKSRSQ
jgi:ribosomal protein S6--L-glutamate ligase